MSSCTWVYRQKVESSWFNTILELRAWHCEIVSRINESQLIQTEVCYIRESNGHASVAYNCIGKHLARIRLNTTSFVPNAYQYCETRRRRGHYSRDRHSFDFNAIHLFMKRVYTSNWRRKGHYALCLHVLDRYYIFQFAIVCVYFVNNCCIFFLYSEYGLYNKIK